MESITLIIPNHIVNSEHIPITASDWLQLAGKSHQLYKNLLFFQTANKLSMSGIQFARKWSLQVKVQVSDILFANTAAFTLNTNHVHSFGSVLHITTDQIIAFHCLNVATELAICHSASPR